MNINKNSWHYRIVASGETDKKIPTNLCPYIRRLIFKSAFFLLFAFVVGFVFTGAGSGMLTPLGWFSGAVFWIASFIAGAVVICGAIAAVIGGGIGIAYGTVKYKERKTEKKRQKEKARVAAGLEPEEPKSLAREWFDAKHDKICPTLEFTDGKA